MVAQAQGDCEEAMADLLLQFQPFVSMIARRRWDAGATADNLVEMGTGPAMTAILAFNPAVGQRLTNVVIAAVVAACRQAVEDTSLTLVVEAPDEIAGERLPPCR